MTLLQALCVGLLLVAVESTRFQHDIDTEEVTLSSHGVLRHMIVMSEENGIKRLLCKDNVILVALDNMTLADDWSEGDLVVGGTEWGCVMTNSKKPNHVELGFHRIIDRVEVKTEKRVDIFTHPAGLFDLFKEAHISYHHRPGLDHSSHRRRRSIVPWEATSEDIPLTYEITPPKHMPGGGHIRYEEEAINTTLSFYEIRMLLDQVAFHKRFTQSLPINYNEDGDSSMGYFGYRNGKFEDNSTYFDEQMEGAESRRKREIPEIADWNVFCENCFMNYVPEVLFELEIDQLIGVKNYTLKFSGHFETNMALRGHADGEVSVLLNEVFHRAPEHVWISIPLVPEIEMKLVPKFNVTMQSYMDLKMSGAGDFHLGYDQSGILDITRSWTPDGQEQSYQFTPDSANQRPHSSDVTIDGELFYNMSMMTTEIDLASNIFWKLPENIFGFYLESPMQIRVEPNLIGRTVLDEEQAACVETEAYVLSYIHMQDVVYDAELLGQKYNFEILPTDDNNTFYMMAPTPVIGGKDVCHIRCYGDAEVGDNLDDACGAPTQTIERGTSEFDKLVQLLGDLVLFAPEGQPGDKWCGQSGRTCLECTEGIVGNTDEDKCSTRMVSKNLASKIDRLAHWVVEEWSDRKLYVAAAWDEPTESNPDGRFGDTSLHYEGRAAVVTVTAPNPDPANILLETDPDILSRLAQFAVCAGLQYVKIESDHVHIGTTNDTAYWSRELQEFLDFFSRVPDQDLQFCKTYEEYFPKLSIGESIPSDKSFVEALGPTDNKIVRRNDREFMDKLFLYPYDNVVFEDAESGHAWCGSPLRECVPCDVSVTEDDLAWSRCSDRVMSPRVAAKLHHLASLVQQELGDKVVVYEAWEEATSENSTHAPDSLHYEGRAVQLGLETSGDLDTLSHLALCAGFDAVARNNDLYIEAAVKNQESYFTVYIPFLATQLLKVQQPLFYDLEYAYPQPLLGETRHGHLYDGAGEHAQTHVSADFTLQEFKAPMRRYVRLYPKLVECLQATRDFIREPIEILAAYKPRSFNMVNAKFRHESERYRFQAGQAAEIRVTGYEDPSVLADLAMAVLKACSAQFRLDQHFLGLGFHDDRVYMHVKVATVYELDSWLGVWNDGGNSTLFSRIQDLKDNLLTGGPPVVPQFWETACDIPELGYHQPHYQVQVRPSCQDRSAEFCSHSRAERQALVEHMKEQMNTILGFADGPVFVKNKDVDKCFADYCGSCNGGGSTWRKKLVACSNMLFSIMHQMFRELVENRGTFFNTDNSESTVHALACRDGNVCLENTQMYSVFAPMIMATYRPDSDRAQEVRLYEGTTNPSPIIDLLEQDMAMAVKGHVSIYIEYERDLSALKKVVKLLMAMNRDVDEIHFHVNSTVFLDHVYERIHDWIEVWRYDVCPSWGREFLAPYTVEVIPEDKIARGMAMSHDRNALQREIRNRDIHWLLKM